MNDSSKPEFDQYANSYTQLHAANIKASGEEPPYFAAYKAKFMAGKSPTRADAVPLEILDFGCGVGNSIPHLQQAFPKANLNGADLSGESVAVASASHGAIASFKVIDSNNLPYEDASFDLILVACVFHHIPPEQRRHWMAELRRVLKPTGQLFVFEHNILNPLTVKAVNDCPFDEDAILLPRKELLGLAKGASFTRVNAQYVVFFPRPLSALRQLEPLMGWIPFGAQYVVYATP
ncbi:class I SAM-dependent methyltransferase [Dyella humicola]|uniref:class I SAM-dependent methyltransferase n=1 Tax=Dyella humicola TaxID=2992126 RepID=UPI00224CFFD3|nr:class I SAM-dependent methyltransferase [Dyella humicola]